MNKRATIWNKRDFFRLLKDNGFEEVRQGRGSHSFWKREKDGASFPLPKDMNPMMCRRIIKQYGLVER